MDSKNETVRKGNPIAEFRFRHQTYIKSTDEPLESEWCQLKEDAIKDAKRRLIHQYKRFGETDMIVKVFNEMNYKQAPVVITLEEALEWYNSQSPGTIK